MVSKLSYVLFIAVVALSAGQAPAQQHQGSPHRTTSDGTETASPFAFTVYGAFRRMMHLQDLGAKAQLSAVIQGGATDAVGAVSGLRGEITVIDGKLLVTYGTPCPTCRPANDQATLLASARVVAWHTPVALPSDLKGPALDAWIVDQATRAGIDVSKPFPVRLSGTLTNVTMHVMRAFNSSFKGHGSGHAMADQENIVAKSIDGSVVGFYAPPDLQGVVTHPGQPFHYHWVDVGHTRTAHLDVFTMKNGAHLLLPKH
ncbi:MAG: acetolactate decarboxylase [Hyphomicrobiaceae bacterium]